MRVAQQPGGHPAHQRILDGAHIPYVFVPMDTALRLPRDPHPNPQGARVIADAITARLRAMGVAVG